MKNFSVSKKEFTNDASKKVVKFFWAFIKSKNENNTGILWRFIIFVSSRGGCERMKVVICVNQKFWSPRTSSWKSVADRHPVSEWSRPDVSFSISPQRKYVNIPSDQDFDIPIFYNLDFLPFNISCSFRLWCCNSTFSLVNSSSFVFWSLTWYLRSCSSRLLLPPLRLRVEFRFLMKLINFWIQKVKNSRNSWEKLSVTPC